MRLFIAINFTDEVKVKLSEYQHQLKKYSLSGNFTRRENFHMTIVFLGEIPKSRVEEVKRVMDGLDMQDFTLSIGGFGRFKRDGGDIWWIGVDINQELEKIYNYLSSSLAACGFEIEKRNFKPHLTLARKVKLTIDKDKEQFTGIPSFDVVVDKISLMESKQINGIPAYAEVYYNEVIKPDWIN